MNYYIKFKIGAIQESLIVFWIIKKTSFILILALTETYLWTQHKL